MKILIVAQHIHPMTTPRAHRATELAIEFANQGHQVVVCAVIGAYDYTDFERYHNIKIEPIPIYFQLHPYSSDNDGKRVLIDRVLEKAMSYVTEFPYVEFYFRLHSVVKRHLDAQLLISIADPHHIHWGIARAKKKCSGEFEATWVADCGDPFMENGKSKNHLGFFSRFEHMFCRSCDFISVPHTGAVNAYYSKYRSKIHVIPQGFRFDLNCDQKPKVAGDVSKFAYAGLLNKTYRDPRNFLTILASIPESFEFHVYSKDLKVLKPAKRILGEKLILHDTVSREVLLEKLSDMDFLINFENDNMPHQTPSKLIDYSILRKPILSVKPASPSLEILREFLEGDYRNAFKVKNIEDYHIQNVVKRFIGLVDKKIQL